MIGGVVNALFYSKNGNVSKYDSHVCGIKKDLFVLNMQSSS